METFIDTNFAWLMFSAFIAVIGGMVGLFIMICVEGSPSRDAKISLVLLLVFVLILGSFTALLF